MPLRKKIYVGWLCSIVMLLTLHNETKAMGKPEVLFPEFHKFYLSKTIIEFNARTQQFEVTCKLFTDDLELALSQQNEAPVHIGTARELNEADLVMEQYMKQHFKLAIDGLAVEWRWVGKQVENDLTYCYMEFYRKPDFSSMTVTTDLLTSQFPEQQNIVDLSIMGTTQTLVFMKDRVSQLFTR